MDKPIHWVHFQIVRIMVLQLDLINNNPIFQSLVSFVNRWNKKVLMVLQINKQEGKIIRIYINLHLKIVINKI